MTSATDFPGRNALAILFGTALLTILASTLCMYVILVQIELQNTLTFRATPTDVELHEEEEPDHETDHDDDNNKKDSSAGATDLSNKAKQQPSSANKENNVVDDNGVARRLHLPMYRRGSLALIVAIITFMTYLLLARSTANPVPSWMGLLIVLGLLLRQSIHEEIRRDRLDRLATIFSLTVMLAMALNLAVYANRQHAQGDIYEGKARIVGYDYSSYTQEKDDTILRTDLEVAWGGWWGCPNVPDQACTAFVSGALCETESEDAQANGGGNRKRQRRRLVQTKKTQQTTTLQNRKQKLPSALVKRSRRTNDENGEEEEFEDEEDMKEENEELQEENEELQEENEELQEENEELQEELDEYAEYAEEEEEEIDEIVIEYEFDDDYYENEYWGGTSWDSVWGEYACEDLFDSDVAGESFDNNQPPGSDEWPFLNIYGNCNTCEAYIVDYYSTEHFQSIVSYKTTALRYGIFAAFSLMVTAYLIVAEAMNGSNKKETQTEKEIELLPTQDENSPAVHGALA